MTFWMVDAAQIDGEPGAFADVIAMPQYNEHNWCKVGARRVVKEHLAARDAEDLPPDHWAAISQQIWGFVHSIEPEDILCAVHKSAGKPQKVYFAEVAGNVYYDDAARQHVAPLTWYKESAGMLRLRPYIAYFKDTDHWPVEVGDKKMRQALRNLLPLPGNWFARYKWLIMGLLLVKLFVMGTRMLSR